MGVLQNIPIADYTYELPEHRIAKYPLPVRDASKLLVFGNGTISQQRFNDLPKLLPENGLLVLNNTKVIHARLLFSKPTGAAIEIFVLEPYFPADYQQAFAATTSCVWKCLIGNKKKWKTGALTKNIVLEQQNANLSAEIEMETAEAVWVRFTWDNAALSFAEILAADGKIPLPPYLNRPAELLDEERYQTVYGDIHGSVAAPTAGLHFTDTVMSDLQLQGIDTAQISLHVGAGTFKPVSGNNAACHNMHREHFSVGIDCLKQLHGNLGNISLTGTTTMRCVESLYWLASKITMGERDLYVDQWDDQRIEPKFSAAEAIEVLIEYLEKNRLHQLSSSTAIMIVPGYTFRFANRLITNFHQPRSTLLLLVAAFVGNDWRNIYQYALDNDFRFLSYGDSTLLFGKSSD